MPKSTDIPVSVFDPGKYNLKFKMLHLRPTKPKGLKSWIGFLWGFDVFFGPVPFCKLTLLLNGLMWWIIS